MTPHKVNVGKAHCYAFLFLGLATPLTAQQPVEWTISPEPVVAFGVLDGDAAYMFTSIRAARILPDGRVAVADRGESSVRIFSQEGEFQAELGGQGEGPGEFRSVSGLWVSPPDTLVVWDADLHRLTTFLADGPLVGTRQVDPYQQGGPGGALDGLTGLFSDGDLALSWTVGGRPEPGEAIRPDRTVLGRFSRDGRLRHLVGEGQGLHRVPRSPDPFSPFPHFAIVRDSIYFMNGVDGAIAIFDPQGEGLARLITVPTVSAVETPRAWSVLQATLRQRGDEALLSRIPEPRLSHTPTLAGMLADDRGLLWVKAYDPRKDSVYLGRPPGKGGVWWVVTSAGDPVARVVMPDDLVPMHIVGNRILATSRGTLDVERIVIHTVSR